MIEELKELKRQIAQKIILASRIRTGVNPQRARTRAEAESGWRNWAQSCFPNYIKGEFSSFHADMWDWGWSIKAGESQRPFVGLWFRHGAKSSSVQMLLTCLGAMKKRKYCWYVSSTQEQADNHVQSVGSMLTASRIEDYYPDLATRKTDKYGTSAGWRRNRFSTQSGFTIDALGLDTASRGMKIEEQRPDILVIDDVDLKKDSPNVVANKIDTLTTSIIPSGSDDLIIIFVQNLIHKDSIASQLADGRAQFMSNRIISGPIPALEGFEYETNPDGTWRITKGEPTWPWFDRQRSEKKLNDMGPAAFLSECQHVVDRPLPGALLREFDEVYHVITDSEFIEGYRKLGVLVRRDADGRAIMPDRFNIGRAEDVGTTVAHPNVTTWTARPSQVHPLKECVFTYRELVFPEWASKLVEPEPVSIKRISEEIHRLEKLGDERYYVDDFQTEDLKRRGLEEYIEWVRFDKDRKAIPLYNRIKRALISHEASSEVNTFAVDLPPELRLGWEKWNVKAGWLEGVAQLQNYLEIRPGMTHPFRNYPDGHPKAGEPLDGCPRYFLLVADGQGELYWAENRLKVKAAINASGLMRGRWEIPKYRLPENTQGVEQAKPLKIDDDWVDTQRALALDFFPPSGPLSEAEKVQRALPATLRTEEIVKQDLNDDDLAMAWLAQQAFINQHGLQKKKTGRRDRVGKYLMR